MVCPMLMRIYAAGLAVIAAVSFTLVPNQAFGRSRFPVVGLPATFGVPGPSLAPLFVLAPTSIRFWGSADWAAWPLLRRVGLYGSILPIFLCLSRRPLSRRCCC